MYISCTMGLGCIRNGKAQGISTYNCMKKTNPWPYTLQTHGTGNLYYWKLYDRYPEGD